MYISPSLYIQSIPYPSPPPPPLPPSINYTTTQSIHHPHRTLRSTKTPSPNLKSRQKSTTSLPPIPPSLPSNLPKTHYPHQQKEKRKKKKEERKEKCASSTKSAAAAATTATSKPDAPTTPEEVSHHVVEHMEFGIRVERRWQGLRIVVRADHRC